jgi:hypothetical protein
MEYSSFKFYIILNQAVKHYKYVKLQTVEYILFKIIFNLDYELIQRY